MLITAHDHANGTPVTVSISFCVLQIIDIDLIKFQLLQDTESKGWVDQFVPPQVSSDGNRMLIISPQEQGSAGRFRHLTLVTRGAKATTALTKGQFVVTSIVAWDEASSKV